MMTFKRLWLWRPRVRAEQRKTAFLVALSMATLFVLNSMLLLDENHPHPRGHRTPPTPTPSPPHPDAHAMDAPQDDTQSSASVTSPDPVTSSNTVLSPLSIKRIVSDDDFFNPYKGKVVGPPLKKTHKTKDNKQTDKQTHKLSNQNPSFGFINENFKAPEVTSDSPQPNLFVDALKNFARGEYGVNPGSLLGAVAALKTARNQNIVNEKPQGDALPPPLPLTNMDSSDKKPDLANEKKPQNVKEEKQMSNINKETIEEPLKIIKDQSSSHPIQPSNLANYPSTIPPKPQYIYSRNTNIRGSERSRSDFGSQNVIGSLISNIGPLLSNNKSPVQSLISNLAPTIISGVLGGNEGGGGRNYANNRIQGGVAEERRGQMKQSNPVQSILSGLGPVLLAGAMSQVGNNESPVQSILGKLGPQVMGNLLGQKDSNSPVQSILGQLGPVVMSNFLGQKNGKSPAQSIISDMGPKVLSNLLGQKDSSSPVQSMLGQLGPVVMKSVLQGNAGGGGVSPMQKMVGELGSNLISGFFGNQGRNNQRMVNSPQNYPNQNNLPTQQVFQKQKDTDVTKIRNDNQAIDSPVNTASHSVPRNVEQASRNIHDSASRQQQNERQPIGSNMV